MQGYFIRSSKVTPSVYFNPKKELLDMRGRSNPENPLTFYNYLLRNLDEYSSSESDKITVNMAFEYVNTSSSKCLFLMLEKLREMNESGKKVTVNWFHENGDDDMLEAGEDFGSFFNYEFNLVEVPIIKVLGKDQKEAA